jgi:hypothetical protein
MKALLYGPMLNYQPKQVLSNTFIIALQRRPYRGLLEHSDHFGPRLCWLLIPLRQTTTAWAAPFKNRGRAQRRLHYEIEKAKAIAAAGVGGSLP